MRSRAFSFVWIVFLAGLALRLALSFAVSEAELLAVDGHDYRDIAEHLAAGEGYSISSYRWFEPVPPHAPSVHPDFCRPPLVPFLGALLALLPGPWIVHARIGAALLGALGTLVVFGLAQRLFDRRTALLAAAAWALYPPALFYGARWLTESSSMLCLGATAWLALAQDRPTRARLCALGLAAALSILARPNLLGPVVGIAAVFACRHGGRALLCAALACAAALAPWTIRNYALTGQPNPTTYFAGYNAWLGMNDRIHAMYADTRGEGFAREMQELYEVDSRVHVKQLEAEGCFEPVAVQRYWWGEAFRYVEEHPERALAILYRRALHFFQPQPMLATATPFEVGAALASTGVAMLLALFALFKDPRAREPLFAAIVAGGFLAALPFVFHLRLRFPILDPLVVVLGARGLVLLIGSRRASVH